MEYVNPNSAAQSTQLVAQTNRIHFQQPGKPKSKDDPSPAIAVYKGRCKVGYVEKKHVKLASFRRLVDWKKTTAEVQSILRVRRYGEARVKLALVLKSDQQAANDDEENDAYI